MRETKHERVDIGTPQRTCSAHSKACTQGLGLLYLKLGSHTTSTVGGHLNFLIRISMLLSVERLPGHLASSVWRLYLQPILLALWPTPVCIRLDSSSAEEYPVGASLCCGVTDRYCQICPFCQTATAVRTALGGRRVRKTATAKQEPGLGAASSERPHNLQAKVK